MKPSGYFKSGRISSGATAKNDGNSAGGGEGSTIGVGMTVVVIGGTSTGPTYISK